MKGIYYDCELRRDTEIVLTAKVEAETSTKAFEKFLRMAIDQQINFFENARIYVFKTK